jgi:hypothetical protein
MTLNYYSMTYTELKDECIICLSDSPAVIKYDAPCDCKPYIHDTCRNDWFQVNPNTCPICKTNYEGLLTEVRRIPQINSCFLLCLMTVLFSAFIYFEYLI